MSIETVCEILSDLLSDEGFDVRKLGYECITITGRMDTYAFCYIDLIYVDLKYGAIYHNKYNLADPDFSFEDLACDVIFAYLYKHSNFVDATIFLLE